MKSDEQLSLNTQTLQGNLWINNGRIMNVLDNEMQASDVKLLEFQLCLAPILAKRVSRFCLKLENTSLKALNQEKKYLKVKFN